MNWLARLKKIDTTPTVEATKPTKPGFVGSVAPGMAPMQKTAVDSPAANDPAQVVGLVNSAAVSSDTVSTPISTEPAAMPDPDRWAWPHSQAMTGREIDTFTARLHHFTRRGLAEPEAEKLADKLVTRDRETDDRRLCLECAHLAGYGPQSWRCGNWQRAGVALKARDAGLPGDLVRLLQRCDGFKDQNQQGTAT